MESNTINALKHNDVTRNPIGFLATMQPTCSATSISKAASNKAFKMAHRATRKSLTWKVAKHDWTERRPRAGAVARVSAKEQARIQTREIDKAERFFVRNITTVKLRSTPCHKDLKNRLQPV